MLRSAGEEKERLSRVPDLQKARLHRRCKAAKSGYWLYAQRLAHAVTSRSASGYEKSLSLARGYSYVEEAFGGGPKGEGSIRRPASDELHVVCAAEVLYRSIRCVLFRWKEGASGAPRLGRSDPLSFDVSRKGAAKPSQSGQSFGRSSLLGALLWMKSLPKGLSYESRREERDGVETSLFPISLLVARKGLSSFSSSFFPCYLFRVLFKAKK